MKFLKLPLVFMTLLLASCGSQKSLGENTSHAEANSVTVSHEEEMEIAEPQIASEEDPEIPSEEKDLTSKITEYAREFLGTGYKYGGTSMAGMDCSGLVHTVFSKEDISLPRTSRDMALLGEKLSLEEVITGDLLFFQTNSKKKVINHVGLVVDIAEQGIFFIHSTISRGVIISSLTEKYWQDHFVMARRIQ